MFTIEFHIPSSLLTVSHHAELHEHGSNIKHCNN